MTKVNNFETALQKLEEAVEQLEGGNLDLEQALKVYTGGIKQADICREALAEIEIKVEQLLKKEDGALSVEGFERE